MLDIIGKKLLSILRLSKYEKRIVYILNGWTASRILFMLRELVPGLQIKVCNKKINFLFINQNICCRCSKEPSQ